jgi:hypothetical protein
MPNTEMKESRKSLSKTGVMLLTLMVMLVVLSFFASPRPAGAQPGDIYQATIIATKDGGQGLQGDYKFRYVGIQDLETNIEAGGPAKGSISFSGGAVSGSVLSVENGTLIFNMNGSFAATSEGYNMTINNVPPEHFTLNMSQDGEFLMGTRGEVSNGNKRRGIQWKHDTEFPCLRA